MTNPNMKELTEEDGKILNLVDHDFEHWSCDVFDMVLHLHLDQPVQDLLLSVQVAVENVGHTVFEENQSRKLLKLFCLHIKWSTWLIRSPMPVPKT